MGSTLGQLVPVVLRNLVPREEWRSTSRWSETEEREREDTEASGQAIRQRGFLGKALHCIVRRWS
jgi:hypothetical protein